MADQLLHLKDTVTHHTYLMQIIRQAECILAVANAAIQSGQGIIIQPVPVEKGAGIRIEYAGA